MPRSKTPLWWVLLLFLSCLAQPVAALDLRDARVLRPGQTDWQAVSLPDTVPRDSAHLEGSATYLLAFDLEKQPEALWALRIDRLASVHRIRLNGHLLHERGADPAGRVRLRLLPAYLAVAPAVLRPGRNELRLDLKFGTRAGLSSMQIGPDDELLPGYRQDRWLDTSLPQMLNVVGATLACILLLLWWRRRQEVAMGWFGALWLIASLRNHDYFVAVSPLSDALSEWLYFSAQASTVGLLGLFAISMSAQPWPRLRAAYLVCLIGLPLLGLVATGLGAIAPLRLVVYPLLVPLGLASVSVLWRSLQPQNEVALAALGLGIVLVVAAGAHDYAYLHGWLPVTDFYWMPYAVPFALACYAAMLLNRLVRGMAEVEELSERLEQRVAQRTAELATANQAKTRFLAAASHDLRQPVAAIGLLVGLVRERVQGPPAVESMFDHLGRSVMALEDLLRGLLDLSRLESGSAAGVVQAPQPVAVQALFDAIALHELAHAQALGLRLRFRPSAAQVFSDPLLLEQMLRNLVSNALRYTAQGSVLVALRRSGSGWRLEVRDSGPGIAPAHQQHIFDEFVQLGQPVRDRRKGQGLGLAIVQRSAALLGHRVGVRSQPGCGSCFWIELPSAPASAN